MSVHAAPLPARILKELVCRECRGHWLGWASLTSFIKHSLPPPNVFTVKEGTGTHAVWGEHGVRSWMDERTASGLMHGGEL